jgi:hypothetical protein
MVRALQAPPEVRVVTGAPSGVGDPVMLSAVKGRIR